jgi:hypothetical protein
VISDHLEVLYVLVLSGFTASGLAGTEASNSQGPGTWLIVQDLQKYKSKLIKKHFSLNVCRCLHLLTHCTASF